MGGSPLSSLTFRLVAATATSLLLGHAVAGHSVPTPSFPGAAGFGATTAGGRGGPVIAVTSLADRGPGTLRSALEDHEGPRIVVFAVEGEIALERQIAALGRLTLLGQVAPGAGVTVTGSSIRIAGDDVIVRGMRIRPGDGAGQDKSARDALTIGVRDRPVRRIVVDGNSFTWATDENVNVWAGAREVTISNNVIAEGLRNAGHPKGRHSMGMLVGDGASKITIAGNLFMSSEFRNPTIADATDVEIINNYTYNFGQHALSFTIRESVFTKSHVVGNVFERGPSSGRQMPIRILGDDGGAAIHLADNVSRDRGDGRHAAAAVAADAPTLRAAAPVFEPSGITALAAADVRDHVLATAGARRPRLDPVDARLIAEASAGAGQLIDSPRETEAGPKVPEVGPTTLPDRDGDFIPDAAEARFGGDPDTPDSHLIHAGSPYAAIELYAHALATGG
jgi:pectate lyase